MRVIYLIFGLILGWSNFIYASATSLLEQRINYAQAKAALDNNNPDVYLKYANNLRTYPLTSYLAYEELSLRLKSAKDSEIINFINNHHDLPQIGWMKLRWLRWLAEREQWQDFLAYYPNDGKFSELDCLHAYYQLKFGNKDIGAKQAEKLWLTGKNHHKTCDNTFLIWKKQGFLTEDLYFKRIILLLNENNSNLASELLNQTNKLKNYAQLALDVSNNPQLLKNNKLFSKDNKYSAEIVVLGLRKLAVKDVDQAYSLLKQYETKISFSNANKLQLARAIGLKMAKNFHPNAYQVLQKYDSHMQNDELSLWRLRLLLFTQDWQAVSMFVLQSPKHLRDSERFQYWHARSLLIINPNDFVAQNLLKKLAQNRSYHGFLAADLINAPYSLRNHSAEAVGVNTTKYVSNLPAIKRALELYEIGEFAKARLEWVLALKKLNEAQLAVCVRLAHQINWHWAAINATRRSKTLLNDLAMLFPTPYKYIVNQKAYKYQIPNSWIFAIMRQESLFVVQAKSTSGAMGLMQVLPSTAQYVAKKHNIDFQIGQILHPEQNINLGSVYLKQLYEQFNNHVLATAAYNAGPNRIKRWLQSTNHLPADVWIEIIPYDETRGYVQNVLTFNVIYSTKLGKPNKLIKNTEFNLNIDDA